MKLKLNIVDYIEETIFNFAKSKTPCLMTRSWASSATA